MITQPTPTRIPFQETRENRFRYLPTTTIMTEAELLLYEVAELNQDVEEDPSSRSFVEESRQYLIAAVEDANAILARRQRVRHRPEAPPWPLSVPDRRPDVDLVKARIDLVILVEKYSLTPLWQAGQQMKGRCPFLDHEDKTASFYVHPQKQLYKCWGCGRAGDALSFVRDFLGVEHFGTALDFLMAEAGLASSERVARVG